MLTYFHGAPEVQPDGLQTLYLMNAGYAGNAAAPAGVVLWNSTMNQSQQHLMGIPLQAPVPAPDSDRPSSIHGSLDMSAIQGLGPHLQHNLWAATASNNSIGISPQLSLRRQTSIMPSAQQGPSISLPQQQTPFRPYRLEPEIPGPVTELQQAGGEELGITASSASAISSRVSGLQSLIVGSKYLKAAQQLLDEVATVGKETKGETSKGAGPKNQLKGNKDANGIGTGSANEKEVAELTTTERQELQMKKAKLVHMLDEVEQRQRQYQHQMQALISSFEAVVGLGSASTYTALALRTISKQFRLLRGAISGQIRAWSKSLGEEDCLGESKSPGSRLGFVDHHLRQQRAHQQLQMVQHNNAWRPQRGLPERSVSVLRAWLFEHFLHPYPKDSDKLMLAKQAGLTRSQVSNWFINARVRLWKPMVEEMYLEETKEQEQNNGVETNPSDVHDDLTSKSSAGCENSPTRTDQTKCKSPVTTVSPHPASNHVGNQANSYSDDEIVMQWNSKKARTEDPLRPANIQHPINVELQSHEKTKQEQFTGSVQERQSADRSHGYSFMTSSANHAGGFGPYLVGDNGRFNSERFVPRFTGNAVSLTLGLPHGEALSLSGAQQSYISSESIPMGRRLE